MSENTEAEAEEGIVVKQRGSPIELRARKMTDENGHTQCTIFDEEEDQGRRTAWITAQEGSYFPLEKMR